MFRLVMFNGSLSSFFRPLKITKSTFSAADPAMFLIGDHAG